MTWLTLLSTINCAAQRSNNLESYYLASPLRREKVQFAQAFQEFAKQASEPQTVDNTKPQTKPTATGFFPNIFNLARPSLQWGLAFSVLALLIFGGWLFTENSRLRFQMEQAQTNRDELLRRESELQQREKQLQDEIAAQQTNNSAADAELAKVRTEREQLERQLKETRQQQRILERQNQNEQRVETAKQTAPPLNRALSVATFILAPPLRGANQLPTISIPAKTGTALMKLEIESDDYPLYQAALRSQSGGKILWQSGKVKLKTSGNGKSLNLLIPARLLKQQIYTLDVSGIAADGSPEIISNYSFEVVP